MKSWVKSVFVVSCAVVMTLSSGLSGVARPGDGDMQMQVQIDELTAKIKANPKDFDAILQRGILYRKLGDLARCEADGKILVSEAPKLSYGYWLLSRVAKDRKDYANGLKWIRECIKRDASNSDHLNYELLCLYELGRFREVVTRSIEIEKTFPKNSHSYYYRAMARLTLKEPKAKIVEDLKNAKLYSGSEKAIYSAADKELANLK